MGLDEKAPLLGQRRKTSSTLTESLVGLPRHITLMDCVGIIVGNVIGSGIFISPSVVVRYIGSVGGTLIIWVVMGVCSLAQALCYAELGAAIPLSGGDYSYVYAVLGPMPAFLCAWTQTAIVAPSTNAVIARTAAIYLSKAVGLHCHPDIILCLAFWILVTFAVVNTFSSKLGTRVQVIFSVAKLAALSLISVTGIVYMTKGYVGNFSPDKIFEGTRTDPGFIGLAALNGYFAYKGWELVNTLPEEMVNPTRDLHLAVWIALLLCTGIYTLTNVAYFAVMTPLEILTSEAVASTFMDKTLGRAMDWVISLSVSLSCMGAINGSFLSDTRYLFAAGRNKQFPSFFSMIHISYFTPVAAMVFLCLASMTYALIPSVQVLTSYTSLAVQLKIILSFIALFYLRWKAPDMHRPVKVNIFLAVGTFLFMLVMIGLTMIRDPITIGLGIGLFFLGVPVYFFTVCLSKRKLVTRFMDAMTVLIQVMLHVSPEEKKDLPSDLKIKK